ncbi:MAG: hypothetical protein IPK76_26075 [Lewinellaceae bacterium]|jgi:hypothetical protein|nr:hypothetical protein [Lewinellaceae bacterium]
MAKHNVFLITMLTSLGEQVGDLAYRCRVKKTPFQILEEQSNEWRRVFPPAEVIALSAATLGLICLDIFFMMPVYRQVSQVICHDANLLALPIGIGVNILAVITGEKLAKCSSSGPFHRWELHKNHDMEASVAFVFMDNNRQQRVRQFFLNFALYLGILLSLIWIRSILVEGTQTEIEKVELQMSLIGLLIALFAVTIGGYLVPAVEYLIWNIRILLFRQQIQALLRRTSRLDGHIFHLWQQSGRIREISHHVKEALFRFSYRSKNMNYCDPVTEAELMAFDWESSGNDPYCSLPE